jgi:regulator of cell morphogenesis and NO signaling
MNISKWDTIESIVTRNLQAASIFNEFGIDFCCDGHRTLENACANDHIVFGTVLEELSALSDEHDSFPDFGKMQIDLLANYIQSIHHKYTDKKLVIIKNNIERLIRQNKDHHLQLLNLKKVFDHLSIHLTIHMKQEEFIIFPYIKRMVKKGMANSSIFRSVEEPISAMQLDHDDERKSFKTLVDITHHYSVPVSGDYAYKVTYAAIKELEEDMRIHMHLENNLLFPKAIELEHQLKSTLN